MENKESVVLEIGEILGYYDLNGADAVTSEQVEKLENYIELCNTASSEGVPLVVDAIYDRMVEVLKVLNPDSELLKEVWGEDAISEEEFKSDDMHSLLRKAPMMSIQTCKSYDCAEVKEFVSRLPENEPFDLHNSVKLNGHGIRLVYRYGYLEGAFSRARHTSGRDLTRQVTLLAQRDGYLSIDSFADYPLVEIRGELLLPLPNLEKAREYNSGIVSALSGVASMSRESASDDEILLLDFVAYNIIAEDLYFDTKQGMYDMLEELGFKVPVSWLIEGVTKDTFLEQLPDIISDCESAIVPSEDNEGYEYFSDGIVMEVNNRDLFYSMGDDGGKYMYGNIAMKVGYWKQDLYMGYVQTILWTQGKNKLSPVAIIASDIDCAVFSDEYDEPVYYVKSIKDIRNYNELGVVTAGGNRVRRVPLFEPNNIAILDAYVGMPLYFRYGGEAGVIPCTIDGTPLADAKIRDSLSGNYSDDDLYEEYEIVN